MERQLSAPEAALWWADQASPVHFVTIARLRGPLTEAALRAGLDAAQARHPLLRTRIERASPSALWFRASDASIPLRHVDIASAEWLSVLEEELALRVDASTGPLVRCVWLRHGPDDHRLLLSHHHSCGDGKSGAWLARDVVASAAAALKGEPSALVPLSHSSPLVEHFPKRAVGFVAAWRTVLLVMRDLFTRFTVGVPRLGAPDADAPFDERRYAALTIELDPDTCQRLVERARAEKTTVHGALCAALSLTFAEDGQLSVVGCASPVDMRGEVEPALAEDVGYFVSMVSGTFRVAGVGLWPLARQIRSDLERRKALLAHFLFHRLAQPLLRHFNRNGLATPNEFAQRYAASTPKLCGVTNLGRLEVAAQHGPLELEQLHFAVASSVLGAHGTAVTTFRGRLIWTFASQLPTYSRERATRLRDRAKALLLAALDAA